MRPQTFTDVPSTRKPSSLRLRLQAGADEPRPNIGGIQKNHPNPAQPCANSSKRCIKRASSDAFLWGLDLSNHGYYWEAHEAWEGLWQVADRDGPLRMLFKGLILLSAAGVKIRERKNAAAARHAMRAAALLRQLTKVPDRAFERALGMLPAALAECAEAAIRIPADLQATAPGQPQAVFNFILGPKSGGRPSGSQERNGHLRSPNNSTNQSVCEYRLQASNPR